MKNARVALCVDEVTCSNPGLIGLDGEAIDGQEWLDVFVAGDEARHGIADSESIEAAWVISCDDVDPINLAATLKSDRPELSVALVSNDGSGSLLSRAHTAAIDEVVEQGGFVKRYAQAKARYGTHAAPQEPGAAAPDVIEQQVTALLAPKPLVATRSQGFIMPVVSGSGGAGKSTVSTMAALIAADMGYRTLLLDYDLQFGDVAGMVGVEGALSIDEAIARPDLLEDELGKSASLTVLAAPQRLEQADRVIKDIPSLLDRASGEFDVVVANTGGAWAEHHALLLERSYVALFLIDQRASSIRACRHALELCVRCGIATGPFEFVLNRCAKGAPLTSADVSCAFQGAPIYELRDGGRDVEDYLGAGAARDLLRSNNELCVSLRQVMERLLPDKTASEFSDVDAASTRKPARKRARHAGRKWGRKQ